MPAHVDKLQSVDLVYTQKWLDGEEKLKEVFSGSSWWSVCGEGAGRWVKASPRAEQIEEKEIVITDSTPEKDFLFLSSHTRKHNNCGQTERQHNILWKRH